MKDNGRGANDNKRHWYKAGEALARADCSWLDRLITRRERALRTLQVPGGGRMTYQGRRPIRRAMKERPMNWSPLRVRGLSVLRVDSEPYGGYLSRRFGRRDQ
jgi:hypothetical protein